MLFFSFSDNKVKDWLFDHGCIPRKSLVLELKNIPNEYYRNVLLGIIDGDGCFCFTKRVKKNNNPKTINFNSFITSGSEKFLLQIQEYLNSIDIKSRIDTKKNKERKIKDKVLLPSVHYQLQIGKLESLKLIKFLYYNDNIFCLERKRENAKELLERYKKEQENKKSWHSNRKKTIKWPEGDDLIKLFERVKENNFEIVGREMGVSGGYVRKILLKSGLLYPGFHGAKSQGYGPKPRKKNISI
jgi:hypothetical protein